MKMHCFNMNYLINSISEFQRSYKLVHDMNLKTMSLRLMCKRYNEKY